ncbi:gll1126 [Gloeobacter violaceus PCC 7421]|uniref:Gll1126 protein n=2 Tax=Gloeobacter violaceus TaxID=33072 RepID=Q7NLJ7_GLOVI|nr:gll1126 [Gloeobacter violaceus PCC 7421]
MRKGTRAMQTPTFVQDAWMRASWESFLALTDNPALVHAKMYYHLGWMRIEMSPVGPAHAEDNNLIAQVVGIFAFSRGIRLKGYINLTLRKTELQEAQPDLAYYLENQSPRPARTNSPVDLEQIAAPALAIEISATTLGDDTGKKRELYAQLGVGEYWVVDAENTQVLLFGPIPGVDSLEPIVASRVLPGLTAATLCEALRLGQSEGDAAAIRYVLDLE